MPKLKQRSDGRFVKTMTDPRSGKRIWFYGNSEREINRKIMEYKGQTEDGKTFAEVADEWWKEAEPNLAWQSVKTYKPAWVRVTQEFGKTPIKNIKPNDISLFLKKMGQKNFAAKTISNQKTVINLIFNHATNKNYIEINPCASCQTPKDLKKTTRTAASPSDEELVKNSADIWLFPYIAIMTGMRKGEILALKWKDVDFANDIIHVTKSVYHEGNRPYIKEPKTAAGIRIVPLLNPLKETLQAHGIHNPEDFIISDDGIKPLTNKRFETLYTNFKKQTGVTCTAHQLRHSFATIAFECGVPVKSVQEILGHKQISTTMDLYTDFRKKSLNDAAELLNKSFK